MISSSPWDDYHLPFLSSKNKDCLSITRDVPLGDQSNNNTLSLIMAGVPHKIHPDFPFTLCTKLSFLGKHQRFDYLDLAAHKET